MMADQAVPQEDAPARAKKLKEFWRCDVCGVEKFDDFDEACRHEEKCRREQQEKKEKKEEEKSKAKAELAKPVHPFFTGAKKPMTNGCKNNKIDKDETSASKIQKRKRASLSNSSDESKNKRIDAKTGKGSKNEGKPSEKRQQTLTKTAGSGTKNVLQDVIGTPSQQTRVRKEIIDLESSTSSENSVNRPLVGSKKQKRRSSYQDSPDSVEVVDVKSVKNTKQKPTSKSKSQASAAPLASIFHKGEDGKTIDEKTLMAEQIAAEFQLKRRLERERERERQQKRQQAFFQNKTKDTSAAASSKNDKPKVKDTCPLFPVPNHVFGEELSLGLPERSYGWLKEEHLKEARQNLQQVLTYSGREILQFTTTEDTPWELGSSSLVGPDESSGIIQNELDKVLTVSTEQTSNDRHRLWADKYGLHAEDVCGTQNKRVAKNLIEFVQEWMVHRHHANTRMAERQKALHKTNKKKARKVQYKDDDDYFDSDEEGNEMPSVCLLRGPVASCKSSLVHAVAKHCGCQVLELNTSDKRGSVNLRKALEEATQSLSSLEMLREREASLFTKQELVDSDDELDDSKQKGASVTIILIDEVDNVFESFGDNGFWSALSDLSRKARCPVFLTANMFPKQLKSSFLTFKDMVTSRPSPEECAHKMKQLMKQEAIRLRDSEGRNEEDLLASIAEYCGCDLRRIFHELQLFAISARARGPFLPKEQSGQAADSMDIVAESPICATIEEVSPKTVSAEEDSLLTIRGRNFCSLLMHLKPNPSENLVRVYIGEQRSPLACVVDDETILAICPPSSHPGDVDRFGLRLNKKTGIRMTSLNTVYVPLAVQAVHSNGKAIAASTSLVMTHTLIDDGTLPVISRCNVEYSFPERAPNLATGRLADHIRRVPSEDEEVEFDFEPEKSEVNKKCSAPYWTPTDITTLEEGIGRFIPVYWDQGQVSDSVKRQFQTELDRLTASRSNRLSTTSPSTLKVSQTVESTLEALSKDHCLASDAALLETYGSLPYLSGASPGFGFDLTPEGDAFAKNCSKLSRHGNSSYCSEERLIATGWKDTACYYGDAESYMTFPSSGRERRMLKMGEALGRNRTSMISDDLAGDQEDDTSKDGNVNDDLTMWSQNDSRKSDEDFFLNRPIPTPLLCLPSILLAARSRSVERGRGDALLESRKEMHGLCLLELLESFITSPTQAKMFCLGLGRQSVSMVTEFDRSLFLDYIPILRNIAILERAAESVPDLETAARTSRTRTRGSKKRGRIHFLETLTDAFRKNETELTASETGQKLAATTLQPSI